MKNYINPVIHYTEFGHTADPYVLRYKDKYYHCYMRKDGVYISVSDTLWELGKGIETKVYDAPLSGKDSLWYAPEIYNIDGKWYIYGAPQIDECDTHCMCVLSYEGDAPVGQYEKVGMIKGLEDTWCIDGTVLNHNGINYFIWTTCAQIYMAQMDSPTSICGKIIALTHPEFAFETKTEVLVNEGPAVLKHGNKIHVIYSANDSKTDEYCLGMLTYSGGDIMKLSNWEKSKEAVFEKTDKIFGPGHCSFTTVTENEKEIDYMVYHANLESGSGWYGRSVWLQRIEWDENDIPIFAKPHM